MSGGMSGGLRGGLRGCRDCGCVILAAGGSTRLGEPKQLARIGGETLLDRAVGTASAAGVAPVVVVLGASAARIEAGCDLAGAQVLIHPGWESGMAGSLRLGISALAGHVDCALIMACDQPAVTGAHLEALVSVCGEFSAGGNSLEPGTRGAVASRYAGRNGVPACFPAEMFGELMGLAGDQGARKLLEAARWVALPGGEHDVDTPEALLEAERLYGGRAGS